MRNSQAHPAALELTQLLADCQIRFTRRTGPGGQHRNKVETAVILRHLPTELEAEANERRSQAENRRMAIWRLRLKLALAVRCPCDEATQPSNLWRSRLRGNRISIRPDHEDFPALLAEALDLLATRDFELPPVAETLGCSASQLWKLLQNEPRAIAFVNAARRDRGLRPLA